MNVGEMQRKLSLWATQDTERKFYGLYDLLCDTEWLQLAHDHVKQNAGSVTAGCDGINMAAFDENLEENLQRIREELKWETFAPDPVRRVYIPKPNGKTRPLGIPAIKDRIVQEALRMTLEPIFEADFSQYSFGFRPTRRTMDAVRYIQWSTSETKKFFWIIEGDIASYFDTINHPKLIRLVRRRIKDKKVLRLIWKFLRSGVMEKRTFRDTKLGTPQGGIISPLLANIYLHELDKYMERHVSLPGREKTRRRQQKLGNFTFARYADDFVVLCNGSKSQAEQMREELYEFLKAELRLELSKEKTKVTHLNDGFKFLGFWIQRGQGGNGITTKVVIPVEAMDKVKTKIKIALTPTSHQDSVNAKIIGLNMLIRGWCQYYQYTSKATTQFNRLGHMLFWEMAHWLGRKFKMRRMSRVMKRFSQDNTFVHGKYCLLKPIEFKSLQYRERFFKPNPYLVQKRTLTREKLPVESYWTGYEARAGMADLRPLIRERDEYICRLCGSKVTSATSEVDHIRPVRRFKRPIDANDPENLWTLCIPCHDRKTKIDRKGESQVR
jgi:group II intron reverse transcriptase/maturase